MFAFRVDTTEICCVWLLSGNVSDDEFERYVATFAELDTMALARPGVRGVTVLVTDPDATTPDAKWRKRIAEASADLRSNPFVVFSMPTALMRGVVTAINWIRPPPYEWHVAASFEEALASVAPIRADIIPRLRELHDEIRHETAQK